MAKNSALLLLLFAFAGPLAAQSPSSNSASTSDGRVERAAPVTYARASSSTSLDDSRRLRGGDRLSFRIVEDRQNFPPLFITDSGEVEVPFIGRLHADGKTCRQLAAEAKSLLERDYYYHASVIIGLDLASSRSLGRVYITGQVRSQGPIEIPSDEDLTLSKAIIKAGGFADFAEKKKVKIVRKRSGGDTDTMIINLDEIISKGRVEKDVKLEADDYVIVPKRLINF